MQGLVTVFVVLTIVLIVVLAYIIYGVVDIIISYKRFTDGKKDRTFHFNLFRLIFGVSGVLKKKKAGTVDKTLASIKVFKAVIILVLISIGLLIGIVASINAVITFSGLNRAMTVAAASAGMNIGSEITDDGSWQSENPIPPPPPDPDPPKPRRTKAGRAEGTFAKALDDGSYYWYHQSQYCLTCQWCGDFSDMKWGDTPSEILAKQGCAVYSLAIIVSNLMGEQITPRDLLTDFGATVTKTSSGKYEADTSTTDCWDNQDAQFWYISQKMKSVYDLDNIAIDSSNGISDTEQQIKDIIDEGGYVWIFLHNQNKHYPFTTAAHHFIVIRKYDANGFYFFDSCMSVECMNTPVKGSEFLNNVTWLTGYVNPNAPEIEDPDDPDGPIEPGNTDWYSSASTLKKYTDTIDLGNGFKLYNGLPWEAESDTYVADTDQMLIDLIDYVNSVSTDSTEFDVDDIIGSGTWGAKRHLNDTSVDCNVQGGNYFKTVADGQYAEVDGVVCAGIGVPPAVLDRSYNNGWSKDGGWTYNPAAEYSKYQYGTKKMAAIMQNVSTGSVYYFPCSNCDAKAHTFPGGVAQTSIALVQKSGPSSSSTDSKIVFEEIQLSKSSSGYDYETKTNVDQTQLATLLNSYAFGDTKYYNFMWNVAEFWNIPKSTYSQLNNSYKVIGFVVWE